MTLTIVSGAAPGAEQGAIEAAINLALNTRGWAMRDHIAMLPLIYRTGLQPTTATDAGMVRRLNCQEADGALVFSTAMVLVGVAAFVDRVTEQMGRAFLHVTLNPAALRAPLPAEVRAHVQDWIRKNELARVYVTGPSADDVPGIQGAVRDALIAILEPFAVDEVRETARQLDLLERSIEVPWPRQPPEPFGPATRADLAELDAVPDPVDSDAPGRLYLAGPAEAAFFNRVGRDPEVSPSGIHAFVRGSFKRGERGGQWPEETCDVCGADPRNAVHGGRQTPGTFANLVVISEATSPGFLARTVERCQADGSHLFIDRGRASRCHFCGATLEVAGEQRVPCVVADPPSTTAQTQPYRMRPNPPEELDEAQRAQLDASIREAERDIRDEPLAPGES